MQFEPVERDLDTERRKVVRELGVRHSPVVREMRDDKARISAHETARSHPRNNLRTVLCAHMRANLSDFDLSAGAVEGNRVELDPGLFQKFKVLLVQIPCIVALQKGAGPLLDEEKERHPAKHTKIKKG